MAVILRTILAGPKGAHQPGERLELDAESERALVDGGFAVYAKDPVRAEAAVIVPRENAAMPPVRRGRK